MPGVFQTNIQEDPNMVVVYGVVHHPAVLTLLHQPQGTQNPEVLGNCRFRDANDTSNVTDA